MNELSREGERVNLSRAERSGIADLIWWFFCLEDSCLTVELYTAAEED